MKNRVEIYMEANVSMLSRTAVNKNDALLTPVSTTKKRDSSANNLVVFQIIKYVIN